MKNVSNVAAIAAAITAADGKHVRIESDPTEGTPENASEGPDDTDQPKPDAGKGDRDCPGCGTPNDSEAKFCDHCGQRLGESTDDGAASDGTDDDDDNDSPPPAREQPPSDEDKNNESSRATAIGPMLGLEANASLPAVKSRVLSFVTLGKAVMSATGTEDPDTALGALRTVVDDAAQTGKLRAENKAMQKREEYRERMSLLHTLNDYNVYPRGDLFVDREVTIDGEKKIVTAPAPAYAEMKIKTLRGLVESKTKGKPRPRANPFDTSKELAEGKQLEGMAKTLEGTPLVQSFANRSTASPASLATALAALQASGEVQQ